MLALAGLIQQIVGPRLEAEQETAIRFADLVIHLYAAESAVLRAYKAVLHNGADQEALKVMLAASYIDDAVPEVEAIARKLVADIAEGTLRDDYLSLVCKELQRYVPQGSIARNRAIAEQINQAQQYIC
ncbi:hypothetical protein [Aneurinibacillus migulanus]|uniref:hypothetical protein n=1 Tax=Aneurinibacillus migulanus TaxID=47500 RepID=UPI00399CEDF9